MDDINTDTTTITAESIVIDRIEAYALSVRPPTGPVSSLGSMPVRNAVLVAITSKEGVTGWGEIWCNFPPRGNLARLNLLEDVIAPHLIGESFSNYAHCRSQLEELTARMAIHTGEYGPFIHCLAGIDTALADLAARSVNCPLANFLVDNPLPVVPVYASTPNINTLEDSLGSIIEAGHRGVKLKIGLNRETDVSLLRDVESIANGRLNIMVDANQNWDVQTAIGTLSALSDYSIDFVEEPLRADAPMQQWAQLADSIAIPIAAGENITSQPMFISFMEQGHLKVAQPDVAKWGGVSGAVELGKQSASRNVMCALHYMGSGLGLAASLHTLAAIGGKGPIELDANPNSLRTELGEIDLSVRDGALQVPPGPGHGFIPESGALKKLSVASFNSH